MQHEYNDGLVPCSAFLLHCGNQCLFFLVIKMAWCGNFLSYKFHHLCWIIGELPRRHEPSKVALEANEGAVHGIRFELQRLEIGSVMGECWGGHGFRRE